MSPSENQPESATAVIVDLNFNDTELTLGLPGAANKAGSKRGFSHTLESSSNNVHTSTSPKSPPHKEQVVGWPPVRASRKNAMKKICKYVKVAVDGAPYLRKVDLEMYQSYDQLLTSLETMFTCLTIRNDMSEKKYESGKNNNGGEYVPTYEDKDGDWMMVGDVPWNMFVESCKRIRLMMSCDEEDTTGLGSRRGSSE